MEQKRIKHTPPPRYDDAFRAGAIRLVTEQHRPAKEVAAELGICIDTLKSWLKAAGVHPGSADRENRDLRRLRELEAEVRTLRRQIAQKDEVIDVLKNPWPRPASLPLERHSPSRHTLQTIEEKYQYILTDRSGVSADMLCRLFEISRSGYYAWLKHAPSSRELSNQQLLRELVRTS